MKIPAAILKSLQKKEHKYHAQRTQCLYGHNHDSKKEAMHCVKLHELQKEGRIILLSRQKSFDIIVAGILICTHRPDFHYYICQDQNVKFSQCIDEVKGMPTPDWILKKKLFCALYPDIKYTVC